MASAQDFYIDTFNFADATAVFTDAALTTCAPDGYYQMGGVEARRQVGCVLEQAPYQCPSCTPPSPSAPPVVLNAYNVKNTITDVTGFVQVPLATSAQYEVDEFVQTDIDTPANSECWQILSLVNNSTTKVITGPCSQTFKEDPLYHEIKECPVTTSGETFYSYLPQLNNPVANAKYIIQNSSSTPGDVAGRTFIYQGVSTRTPIAGIDILNTVSLTSETGCPAVPVEYSYWNGTSCTVDHPEIRVDEGFFGGVNDSQRTTTQITIRAPKNAPFISGTSVIKVTDTGWENICILIGLQRSQPRIWWNSSNDPVDLIYNEAAAGTPYNSCTNGSNPCFVITPEFTAFQAVEIDSGDIQDVIINNINSQDQRIKITGITGCYLLTGRNNNATALTIEGDCISPPECTSYSVEASSTTGVSLTGIQCDTGSVATLIANQGDVGQITNCLKTKSSKYNVIALGNPLITNAACSGGTPSSDYFYYEAVECSNLQGAVTIVRSDLNTIVAGNSVKINNGATCYQINGDSNAESTNDITSIIYDDCDECAPPSNCTAVFGSYESGSTVCGSGNNVEFFPDNGDFGLATYIYLNNSCQDSVPALTGVYTTTRPNGSKISRTWNGVTLSGITSCDAAVGITATIGSINYTGISGGSIDEAYDLEGDAFGSQRLGTQGVGYPTWFSTTIKMRNGWVGTGLNVTFNPTTSTSNEPNVEMILTGTITRDPSKFIYSVKSCGGDVFIVSSNTSFNSGTVITFMIKGSVTYCGTVGAQLIDGTVPDASATGNVPPSGNCNDSICLQ